MADDAQAGVAATVDGETPGARLRRAREATDQSTRDIARKLHVDTWILDAIERDEFGALGAPVFAKGHLRKYALELGVEPDDLMVGYYQLAGSRESPPLIAESILRMESASGPALGWLLPAAIVVAAVASVAAGAMWYLRSDSVPKPASAAAVVPLETARETSAPSRRSAVLALPAADAQSDANQPASEAGESAAAKAAVPEAPAGDAVVAAVEQTRTAPPAAMAPAPSEPVAAAGSTLTLTLRFRDESWVEIYDRDRNKLLYGMGEADTVRYLSGPPPLAVFLGRYGAVDLEVDGEPYTIPREARRTNTARFRIGDPDATAP